MLVHWLWLAQRKQVPVTQRIALLNYFGDAEQIYLADEKAFLQVEGITRQAADNLMEKSLDDAQAILKTCGEKSIGVLTYGDGAYPNRLKNMQSPPLVLYYKGCLPNWQQMPVIGVVGTRKASAKGLQNAEKMGYEIAACGALVVSGGAEGIDERALAGAMKAGGKVVAVLGFGADVVYPAKHRKLFDTIQKQGCVLTEYAPGTRPNSWNFPMRNRIISGLSAGVLVVEAPMRSGALNTARHAADQGRDLFVVPGNLDQDSCRGSNELLRERAIPAFSGWDVVREYESLYPYAVKQFTGRYQPEQTQPSREPVAEKKPPAPEKCDKNAVDNRKDCQYSVLEKKQSGLTPEERLLLDGLTTTPISIDTLLAQVDLPSGKALSLLTMLTLKGIVVSHPGNRVSI